MRLPSYLLATLTLAGCEPAHHEPACKSEPIVVEHKPEAGPKLVQPTPEPQPTQPVIKKQDKRLVWASVCGHSQLVPDKAPLVKCGKG